MVALHVLIHHGKTLHQKWRIQMEETNQTRLHPQVRISLDQDLLLFGLFFWNCLSLRLEHNDLGAFLGSLKYRRCQGPLDCLSWFLLFGLLWSMGF